MQRNSSLEYWGLFQGRPYLKSLDKVEFEKSISVYYKYLLGYQLKSRKRRKRVDLKNREIFRDNSHQSSYKNTELYNDIDWNPGPVYMNELPL